MKINKKSYNNCYFITLYLILRGKARYIIGVSNHSALWPHHYLVMNKQGHVLHFQHENAHEENTWAPWWFEGRLVGIKRVDQQKMLAESDRKLLFKNPKIYSALAALLLVWVIGMPIWMFFWSGSFVWWNIKWAIKAIMQRLRC